MRAVGLLDLTKLVGLLAVVLTLDIDFRLVCASVRDGGEAVTNYMVLQFSNGVGGWVLKDDLVTVGSRKHWCWRKAP